MNITGNIGNMYQGPIQTRPYDFGTDAIERQRVSTGQSLIDADFEYGLQATKWQTFSEIRKYPSFYETPGTDLIPTSIKSDGAAQSIITVNCTTTVTIGSIVSIQGVGAGNVSDRLQGLFIVTGSNAGVSFNYQAKGQVSTGSNELLTSYTTVRRGGYYNGAGTVSAPIGNCKIPVVGVPTISSGTVTVTSSSNHGLIAGNPIAVTGYTGVTAINGNWIILSVQTPTTFTYFVSGASGTVTGSGSIYVQTYSYAVHRPFDGGVLISPAIPSYSASSVRQSKKVFRYQSGKGLIWSSGTLFCPNNDISNIVVGPLAQQLTITSQIPHGAPQQGATVQIRGVTTPGVNGTYSVASIQDSFNIVVNFNTSLSVGTSLILGDQPRFIISNWHGSSVRVGTFDDQNGLFWEWDGQTLWVVKRSSTFQLSGLVYCSNNGQTLFGIGTRFGQQLRINDKFVLRGMTHAVTSIIGDTQLTFNPPYRGAVSISAAQAAIACKIKEIRVPQTQFNRDTIDGKGASGFNIDLTKMQMLGLQYTWYGAGFIDFMVRGTDGNFVFAHRFKQNNINDEAYMRTGNMPVRYELINESIHTVSTLSNTIDTNPNNTVTVSTPFTPTVGGTGTGNILVDSLGINLYIINSNTISKILISSGSNTNFITSGLSTPQAITLGNIGNIFIADSTGIISADANGILTSTTILLNDTTTQAITNPKGIVLDSNNNLCITAGGSMYRCKLACTLPQYNSKNWSTIPFGVYTGQQFASLLSTVDFDVVYNGSKFVFTGKTISSTVIPISIIAGTTSTKNLYYAISGSSVTVSIDGVITIDSSYLVTNNVKVGCPVVFSVNVGAFLAGTVYYVISIPSSTTITVSQTSNGPIYSPGSVTAITTNVTFYNISATADTSVTSFSFATITNNITTGFTAPTGIAADSSGNVYITDTNTIKVVLSGTTTVTTIAGTGTAGSLDNATGTSATLNTPSGLTFFGGFLYVCDKANNLIRSVLTTSPYPVVTIAGSTTTTSLSNDGPGRLSAFNSPSGIANNKGIIYSTQSTNIRQIQLSTPTITLNDSITYWPNSGTVLIDNELINYTGKSGTSTLTGITRAATITYNINDTSTSLTHSISPMSHLGGTAGETVISLAALTPTVSGNIITVPGLTIDSTFVNSVVVFGTSFTTGIVSGTPYYILTVSTSNSFTISSQMSGTVITPTGATTGTFILYKMPASVNLISLTCCPSLTHWGSALIMDGLFDQDRGYLFNYQVNAFGITSPLSSTSTVPLVFNLFLLRLAPSVSNGVVGDMGSRELLNRAQLLLQRLDVWAMNGTATSNQGGSVVISGILNPSFTTTNTIPGNNWTTINSSINGSQPSFAQVCNFGSNTATNSNAGSVTVGTYVAGSGERVFSTINNAGSQNSIDLSGLKEICNGVIGGTNCFPDGPDTLLIQMTIPAAAPTIANYSINLFWGEAQA